MHRLYFWLRLRHLPNFANSGIQRIAAKVNKLTFISKHFGVFGFFLRLHYLVIHQTSGG